jgi:hypothetical protein
MEQLKKQSVNTDQLQEEIDSIIVKTILSGLGQLN